MQKFDLHMHTLYCDGKNSPEEMIRAAVSLGLDTVGLSGHSYTWFDESYCMSLDGTAEYIEEVNRLGAEYADRIRVLLGVELDYHADIDTSPFDYIIGSGHYILKDGVYIDSDYTSEILQDAIDRYFGGDPIAAAERYYEQVGDIVRKTDCDIVGHFDLITKFNETWSGAKEGKLLIDTSDSRYINAWKKAVDRIFEDAAARPVKDRSEYINGPCRNRLEGLGILKAGDRPVFEINTGAMGKGYRTSPYPAQDQIEYIRSKGGILILSSDSHSTDKLCYGFEDYLHLT